jgi:hypothetical protein
MGNQLHVGDDGFHGILFLAGGFGVQGSGFRVQGSGFGDYASGKS